MERAKKITSRGEPEGRRKTIGRIIAALLLALGSAAAGSQSASATHSTAAPTIDAYGIGPNTGPKAGGTPFRIHGTGFHADTISVVFDKIGYTANAAKVTVVDDNLLTAEAPPAPLNSTGATTVKVITENGTATKTSGWFYYDPASTQTGSAEPKITLSKSTGLSNGEQITVSVSGYPANSRIQIAEASPLATFLEPRRWVNRPNPEIRVLTQQTTLADGTWSGLVTVIKGQLKDPNDAGADPAAYCPSTTGQAGFGLRKCFMVATDYGNHLARTQISFKTGEPSPAAPTLNASNTSPRVGDTINVDGSNWGSSPVFGSATNLAGRVGTTLTIQICGLGGNENSCSAQTGTGTVALTRYVSTYGGTLNGGSPPTGLSGATLSGSIQVGSDVPVGCTTCKVKVTQAADTTYPGTVQSTQTKLLTTVSAP